MSRAAKSERCDALLSDIVTHMPDAFLTLDREWRYTFVNDAAVERVGTSRDELLGRRLWDLSPGVSESVAADLRRAMDERVPVTFEARSLVGDTWNEIRVYPSDDGIAVFYTDITERRQAERQALRLFSTNSLLLESTEALSSHTELEKVLPAFADVLLRVVPHKRIAIALYDEQRGDMTILYSRGERALPPGSVFPYEDVSQAARQALKERRAAIVDYDRLSDEEAGAARRTGARLSLVVPLVLADEVIGLVFIDTPDERITLGAHDVDVARAVSSQAAAVIDRARLYDASQRELETTQLLLRTADALAESLELGEVLDAFARQLLAGVAHTRTWVFLWDETERTATLAASVGSAALPTGATSAFDELSAPIKRLLDEKRTQVVDYDSLPPEQRRAAERFGSHVVLQVPLVQKDRLVGLVAVDDPGERREFTQREIDIAHGIASQAAVAIENARLFASTQESGRLSEALNSVNAFIHSTLNLEQVAQRVLEDGVRALGCDAGTIEMLDGDEWVVTHQHGFSAQDVGRRLKGEEAPNATCAACTREPVAIAEMRADQTVNVGFVKQYGLTSVLATPLLVKDNVIGCALFYTKATVKSFTPAEIDFGRKFGATVGLAFENVRLYEASQSALARMTVLKETATASSTLDVRELAEGVLDTAERLLGAKSGAVYRLDRDYGVLRLLALRGYPDEQKPLFEDVSLDERSVTGQAVLRDEVLTFTFDELSEATRERAEAVGETANGWLTIPVHSRGRAIGALTLVFGAQRRLSEEDVALFTTLADELGVAMDNARLYEAERERARLGEALTTVDEDIHSTTAEEEILRRVVPEASEAIGCESAAMGRREGDHWVLRYEHNLREGLIGRRFADSQLGLARVAADMQQVVAVDNALEDSRVNEATRREFEARSFAVVPLIARDETIGVIYFIYHSRQHVFTDGEVDFLRKLGASVSLALENARLFETERERTRFGQSIAEIHAALASLIDVEETIPAVLERVVRELGAYGAITAYRVSGGWLIRHLVGLGPGLKAGTFLTDEQTPTAERLLRTRESYVVEDTRTAPDVNTQMAEKSGYRSYAIFPLILRGELVGSLSVLFAHPRSFTEAELDYLRRAAFAVTLAEENSRLYKAEHRVAQTLQSALLTLPDRISGVEFAHLYHSATEEARVGGDFYDLFELEHDRVGITVGDISGHGVDAAVLTSLVKNTIRVQATEQDKTPAEVVASANRILFRNSPSDLFATVFFGVLDCSDGGLAYCNAGHTTGACLRSSGAVTKLQANSSLVGAFADVAFADSTEQLERGDLLFLYTDGLTEARRATKFFGEQRVFDILAREVGRSPNEVVREMLDEVLSFTGGTLSDDLAILDLQWGSAPKKSPDSG